MDLLVLENTQDEAISNPGSEDDRGFEFPALYPFHIIHLGRTMYTLGARSLEERRACCDAIIMAKTEHARSLAAQHAEPFTLRVLAHSSFKYAYIIPPSVHIGETPLDKALTRDISERDDPATPEPFFRSDISCATTFTTKDGIWATALATEDGVYIRGGHGIWTKVRYSCRTLVIKANDLSGYLIR